MDSIYNKEHGDQLRCVCGHAYIAHFDKTPPHVECGCAHCCCGKFERECTITVDKTND